jgi:predicted amidohydrolase YtcJ
MFTILVAAMALNAAPPVAADLVLKNGRVWTVDRERPEAQAVALWRDRIIHVGADADAEALVGPRTRVIDLKGRRVLPGFYDSHAHVLSGGQLLGQVNLKDCKDEAEFGALLRKFDRELPRDRWLLGGNWDHDRAFAGKLPTAAIVDKYVPDRPVFIHRYDGHMSLANTRALALAGVTAATKDPAGGVVYRLADGKTPSGVLKDNAMGLVGRVVPAATDEEVLEAVRAALGEARRVGVTSIQDLDGSDAPTRRKLFRAYQQLARAGKLTCRIDLRWPIAAQKELTDLGAEAELGGDFIRIGGVKGFLDGSLGSSTAKMYEPYEGDKENTGVYVTPREEMAKLVAAADAARLPVAVHAIGDRANAELLDIFAAAAKANGPRDRRFRVEHVQHLRPEEFKRFKELDVIASLQPYHLIDDGRWAEGRIGTKRCTTSYANRSLLDAGARLAFGSDWPVAPLDPLPGLDAAVNRRTLDGKHPGGWFPEQKITVKEAIEAYTLGSAYAGFAEKDRGSITAGKLADLVVLDRDILDEKERDRVGETKVVLTVVGGKVVFEK